MNLRGQILLGSVALAVLPLILVIMAIRTGVEERFTELDTVRVDNQIRIVRDDLARQSRELATLLDKLAETMVDDNDFRLGTLGGHEDKRGYVLDFAPRQMSVMDLDMLLIQDERGHTVSSGHFRDAYGALDPDLHTLLSHARGGQALVATRTPEESFLALARSRPVTMGGRGFFLTGGDRLDQERLSSLNRDGDLALAIVWPEGSFATSDALARRLAADENVLEAEYHLRRDGTIVRSEHLPLISDGKLGDAWLLVTHDRASLNSLLRDMNLRMGAVLLLAVVVSVLLAVFMAGRISKPLRQLADRTGNLDLESLDVDFSSSRKDEVGRLSRLLGEMTGRLRDGVKRLRAAEHRATLGEMARQVNHDIRNGITPLRNVLRHLSEVADENPARLNDVFGERRETLEGGLVYLEDLATHYARLSPGRSPRDCRLYEVVAEAMTDPSFTPETKLVNTVPGNLPAIQADPVSLRRIFDNLIRNALESLSDGRGTVTVDAAVDEDPNLEEMRILVSVSDTGEGIPAENLDAIFTDFFTTREGGTGLGLSNVRRLAADCGANIRVTSEPGHGTTFTLSFPIPDTADKQI
ncbi:MAG: ATP-binding protein [Candidatus Krumholzibacteriota bacterium]